MLCRVTGPWTQVLVADSGGIDFKTADTGDTRYTENIRKHAGIAS